MGEPKRIDLKEVNNSKRQFKVPKILSLFNRQKGILRDNEGKFTVKSGGGGVTAVKEVNLKRALPVVAIVTLVGGVMVYQSFAGVPRLVSYRYDVSSCNQRSSSYASCLDRSAGALVYRSYVSFHGKEPLRASYDIWTRYVAKGSESTITCEIIGSTECMAQISVKARGQKQAPVLLSTAHKTALAKKLYQNTFHRDPSSLEARQLITGSHYNPTAIVQRFVKSPTVINEFSSQYRTYLKKLNEQSIHKDADILRPASCPEKPQLISRGGNNSLKVTYRIYTWDSKSGRCTYRDQVYR